MTRQRHGGNGYAVSRDLKSKLVAIAGLRPLGRETREHPAAQVRKLAASLSRFGFVCPILVDTEKRVIAGWGLVQAAKQLDLGEAPAITVSDLSEADLRALRLALNRLGEDSAWDHEALALEFREILELAPAIELEITGFELAEIDSIADRRKAKHEDEVPLVETASAPLTRPGDMWILGDHRLLCADARLAASYARVLDGEKAGMMFTAPDDTAISGYGSRLTPLHDSTVTSGEAASLESLLFISLGHAARYSMAGAMHFVASDWRNLRKVLSTGEKIYGQLKDICVWVKDDAGTGSFYLSQHALVFLYQVGKGEHVRKVRPRQRGRHRTNVQNHTTQGSLQGSRKSQVAVDPSRKPVAMIADAICDCSRSGDVVIDPFGGLATMLIAAERVGRRARVIEIDPRLVDVSVARWQRLTGAVARHADTGHPFGRASK